MAEVTVLPTPVLTTIPRVELGEVGRWNISNIDGWEPTPDDFANAVAALDCPAVRRPVLKLGHTGEHGEGDPAIGYIDNMATTRDGHVLVGDYAGVPAWLAEVDDNGNSVIASAYPDRSGEWQYDYVCQLGHTHPFVLHAMALLGVVRPGIGTLASLHDLYTNPPEPLMPAASTTPASAATADDVRRAYYAGPGQSWDLWIREMFIDPPELIVENEATSGLERVPYSIGSDGNVTFADGQPVKVEYVAARAKAEPNGRRYASRAESRPGTRPTETTTPAASPAPGSPAPNQEGTGMDPVKLREALGLAADASDIEVSAALAVAGLTTPAAPAAEATTETEQPAEQLAPAAGAGTTDDDPRLAEIARLSSEVAAMREAERVRTRDNLLASAISEGRITPAEREQYGALYDQAPDATKALLAAKAKGSAVPVGEIGHSGAGEDAEVDAEIEAFIAANSRPTQEV